VPLSWTPVGRRPVSVRKRKVVAAVKTTKPPPQRRTGRLANCFDKMTMTKYDDHNPSV
jgi:hypothetical protein